MVFTKVILCNLVAQLNDTHSRHQVLPNPEDIGPLKATIGWEALVHPDHPLRKPGQDGLELFIGRPYSSQPPQTL